MVLCLMVLFTSLEAKAELLAYEGFSYPLLGEPGGIGFASRWQAGGFNAISHDNFHLAGDTLNFGDLRTSGQSLSTAALPAGMAGIFRKFSRPIGDNGTVAYLSFLLRPDGILNGGYSNGFFGLCLHASKESGDLFIGKAGSGPVSHGPRAGLGELANGAEQFGLRGAWISQGRPSLFMRVVRGHALEAPDLLRNCQEGQAG